MKSLLIPILFALGTALCWGMYGPALGNARSTAKPPEWSPFKPYVFIGVAYLVIAIVGGLIAMKINGDTFDYSGKHSAAMNWGFIAGSLGAAGAFFLTNAVISSKGNTALVMPIVFGGAVTVNAVVSYVLLRSNPNLHINPLLWVGMILVFAGVVVVAKYTPHGAPPRPPAAEDSSETAESDSGKANPYRSPSA
jgi:drug/metabolite transporter (DMT)-like permease